MEYPRVVTNSDGAGVVDQVGPGVDKRWLAKRVRLYNGQRNGRWMGTAAEYIALSVDLVTELADNVSFAEGATLGVPTMTAHRAVFVAGPVQGKTLLVTGGGGAVGHYAVQLAAWAGATVIATVSSTEKAERARAGGAAHVVNYRTEDVDDRVLDINIALQDRRRRGNARYDAQFVQPHWSRRSNCSDAAQRILAISSDNGSSVASTDIQITQPSLEFAEEQRRSALRPARSVGNGIFYNFDGTRARNHDQAEPQTAAQFSRWFRIRPDTSCPRR